jgi:hypothetical protein
MASSEKACCSLVPVATQNTEIGLVNALALYQMHVLQPAARRTVL